jgi:hypothetical protein
MPKYIITESRSEIWHYKYEIEAQSEEEAESIWGSIKDEASIDAIGDYIDTIDSNLTDIKKL